MLKKEWIIASLLVLSACSNATNEATKVSTPVEEEVTVDAMAEKEMAMKALENEDWYAARNAFEKAHEAKPSAETETWIEQLTQLIEAEKSLEMEQYDEAKKQLEAIQHPKLQTIAEAKIATLPVEQPKPVAVSPTPKPVEKPKSYLSRPEQQRLLDDAERWASEQYDALPSSASMADYREIQYEHYQKVDAQLNGIYQVLRQNLPDAEFKALQQTQRQWIKDRDAYAESQAKIAEGGTAANDIYNGALLEYTTWRIEEWIDKYSGN
ncbi:lysozyme inhibitor LprI family protein [Savagea faecisuis]|uniref:Lysozyme inhibitor LprI family protein n=1 Tax=Savagea faecisuis TaxID=1274803 RepID=A0ABW3GX97_9BACL